MLDLMLKIQMILTSLILIIPIPKFHGKAFGLINPTLKKLFLKFNKCIKNAKRTNRLSRSTVVKNVGSSTKISSNLI